MADMSGWQGFLDDIKMSQESLVEYLNSKEYLELAGAVIDDGNINVSKGKSEIHGAGMFANQDFRVGEQLGFAKKDGNRTYIGRYTNHSDDNNTKIYYIRPSSLFMGNCIMVAIQDISEGEELLLNYRDHLFTPQYYG